VNIEVTTHILGTCH